MEETVVPSFWHNLWLIIRGKTPQPTIIKTNIKAKMEDYEVLMLFNRSSNPSKGLILANGVGVVDSDYYNNSSNEGNIGFAFFNLSPRKTVIKAGEKIGQGVFMTYLRTNDDSTGATRKGGFGSTGS